MTAKKLLLSWAPTAAVVALGQAQLLGQPRLSYSYAAEVVPYVLCLGLTWAAFQLPQRYAWRSYLPSLAMLLAAVSYYLSGSPSLIWLGLIAAVASLITLGR